MASTNLGKVSITPKGEYVPESVYNRLDLVRFEGSSFLVLQDGVVGVTPSDDGQKYSLLAQKGDTGAQGERGPKGETGAQGEKGDTGAKGEQGAQGAKGDQGESGAKGEQGEKGADGFSPTVQTAPAEGGTTVTITDREGAKVFTVKNGAKGDKGERGEQGAKGETGAKGEQGKGFRILGKYESLQALKEAVTQPEAGDAYSVGASVPYDIYIYDSVAGDWTNHGKLQGAKGEKGDAGPAGAKGDPGPAGAQGQDGAPGAQGADGFSPTVQTTPTEDGTTVTITDREGTKVFTVKNGAKGDKGERGERGQDGAPGKDGAKGEKGETGPAGADGAKGDKGDAGPAGADGAKGEKGEPGAKGDKGEPGQAASLRIGSVQTGQAGTQAQVTNSGTALEAVFDFVIPQGEKGEKGEPGAKGDKGDTGPQGVQGPPGTAAECKRTARFIVGTSTAGWTAVDCDYLCDGTDDQVEINAAIQALPTGGGEVVVLDGTYNITAHVVLNKENITLSGNGFSTILNNKNIEITSNGCMVNSLKAYWINCKSSNNIIARTISRGIYLNDGSNDNLVSENLIAGENKNQGISCFGYNNNITRNIIQNLEKGIYVASDSGNLISNNVVSKCTYAGIEVTTDNSIVATNLLADNKIGIIVSGKKCMVSGSRIYGYTEAGIRLSGKFNTVSENNLILGNGTSSDYEGSTSSGKRPIAIHASDSLITGNISIGKEIIDQGSNNTLVNNKY